MVRMVFAIALLAAFLILAPFAGAQKGTAERVKVHSKFLEGNLEGDLPDRDVTIYLPPSYKSAVSQRYPVVYMLHGFTDNDEKWMGLAKHWINLPAVIDKALAGGEAREMIVVMPNAFTRYFGSMYSNSVTIGDWEDFIAQELVQYIDTHYFGRCKPRSSRALHGRIRRYAYRNEAPGDFLKHLSAEPMLSGRDGKANNGRDDAAGRRRQGSV